MLYRPTGYVPSEADVWSACDPRAQTDRRPHVVRPSGHSARWRWTLRRAIAVIDGWRHSGMKINTGSSTGKASVSVFILQCYSPRDADALIADELLKLYEVLHIMLLYYSTVALHYSRTDYSHVTNIIRSWKKTRLWALMKISCKTIAHRWLLLNIDITLLPWQLFSNHERYCTWWVTGAGRWLLGSLGIPLWKTVQNLL